MYTDESVASRDLRCPRNECGDTYPKALFHMIRTIHYHKVISVTNSSGVSRVLDCEQVESPRQVLVPFGPFRSAGGAGDDGTRGAVFAHGP